MKKILSLLAAAAVTVLAVSGCTVTDEDAMKKAAQSETELQSEIDITTVEASTESETEITEPETEVTEAKTEASTAAPVKEVSVRPAEWVNVEWESYSNQYFTLSIPKGWNVQWDGNASRLQWMATKPDNTVGFCNIDHNYAAKDASMEQTLGMSMSLSEGTVQEYFETLYKGSTEYFTVQNSCVPANKEALQATRPNTQIKDYKSLYATFKDENVEGEGIYSAVVMDSPDVIIRGANYGTWEINCTFTEWAPQGQFVKWNPVLATIAQSFSYTDYYIQEWQALAQSTSSPTSSVNDPDPVMEAFEERSKSDTIIQEKRSDMLEEYERVYDNSSGEIYRAYSGFLDDMGDQNRYTPITDDQYTEGYVGWIDK